MRPKLIPYLEHTIGNYDANNETVADGIQNRQRRLDARTTDSARC